ncbi:hypothetical protein MAC_00467 [Metarhizium acridum CQMa 102]|uniref:Uncharacterized protein n=1 Tax=Metarhizium acridum (strain CQMa 102) TaxID=655827 RepID=E9DS69_METAQ|nr:uncharacterized protein MAC_00467 [Metarhizium acridum CQMa 102]EFY93229.1 hypothetical protein MAC_00467 [Metarhizium acridum CQMa 102]
MDEPSSAIHTIVHIVRYIAAALSLPLRLAWIPLSYVLALVSNLLAPAGYILGYLGGWVGAVAGLLVSLEFSVAAFIGVIAGVLMAVASAVLTTYFNMQDEPEDTSSQGQREALAHSKQVYLEQQYLRQEPQGLEPDWHWADTSQSQSQSPARLRRVSGLQTETILEEDDSEE